MAAIEAIKAFQALLSHPAPAFACYACGDPDEKEGLVAPVAHKAHAPAKAAALDRIPDLPGAATAHAFYADHDGALLFTTKGLMAAQGGPDEGVELFPLRTWAARTRETVEFWEETGYHDERMPYSRNDFLAVAHVRGASTYIHWVVRGPNAGRIYWWPTTMPPGKRDPPLAATFESFIETICTQPVHFLNELIFCYTRFSDGKTRTQWIPKRYIPDRRTLAQ
jgi:hypothetical protein